MAGALREGPVWPVFRRSAIAATEACKYGKETGRRILALLDVAPPKGYANWTGALIAKALLDVHVQYVHVCLTRAENRPFRRKSWCQNNDPEFAAKAADIVGLYMAPPDNATVLAVDEKPSIQALERAQGYLKLPNGRAMTGQSMTTKQRQAGTTTLFAALDLANGEVVARQPQETPARRIPRLHEHGCRRLSATRNPCRPRQPIDP